MLLRPASILLLLLSSCIYVQFPKPTQLSNDPAKAEKIVREQARAYLIQAQKIVANAERIKGKGFEAAVANAILNELAKYPDAVWEQDEKQLRKIVLNAMADVAERFGYVPVTKQTTVEK